MLTFACTVCGAGQEGTEWAYLAMTGVVSLTPLAMIGGVALWLYRASKRRASEDALRAQALPQGLEAMPPPRAP